MKDLMTDEEWETRDWTRELVVSHEGATNGIMLRGSMRSTRAGIDVAAFPFRSQNGVMLVEEWEADRWQNDITARSRWMFLGVVRPSGDFVVNFSSFDRDRMRSTVLHDSASALALGNVLARVHPFAERIRRASAGEAY